MALAHWVQNSVEQPHTLVTTTLLLDPTSRFLTDSPSARSLVPPQAHPYPHRSSDNHTSVDADFSCAVLFAPSTHTQHTGRGRTFANRFCNADEQGTEPVSATLSTGIANGSSSVQAVLHNPLEIAMQLKIVRLLRDPAMCATVPVWTQELEELEAKTASDCARGVAHCPFSRNQ